MQTLTLIIPCYNESEALPYFYEEVCRVGQELKNYRLELLFVDDGSKDGTLSVIKGFAEQDERVKYLSFSRNFGKEGAMYAGFCNASGDLVAVMDADMQDPPSLLPQMLQILEEGEYDSVATRRVNRKGEPKIRSFFARMFYKIMAKISNADIVDGKTELSEKHMYVFKFVEGYCLIAAMPVNEAMFMRDASMLTSIFMQVIIFATLFVFIYILIKRVIINNLKKINDTLGRITEGDLNVTVDVRSSKEFSSLSDDINSTVSTLKHYIDEAAARFDKDLEIAKQNAADNEVTYEVSNFTNLPDDWKLYEKCDKNNTSTGISNGDLVITNKNTTSAALYYGSVYYVDYGRNWKDFTFEVTLKQTEAADGNRWCGIGYHTQEVAGNMMGYLMNYRSNGDSAFSVLERTSSSNFLSSSVI